MAHLAIRAVASRFCMMSLRGDGADDRDRVFLEVMFQLLTRHEHPKNQLLPMWVALLGEGEDLADEIHRCLDGAFLSFFLSLDNYCHAGYFGIGRNVQEHRFLVCRSRQHWRVS